MTHTTKTCGGLVAALAVCLLLPFAARSPFAEAFLRCVHGYHSNPISPAAMNPRMAALPNLFFWAWERPEDLRFLAPSDAGVAFLAKTIYVPSADDGLHRDARGSLFVRPRLQPLRVALDTPLIAVVRIETRAGRQPGSFSTGGPQISSPAVLTPIQNHRLVEEIVELQKLPNIRAIQIDFDATVSERASYALLLKDLRHNLPASFPLSITALASWCIGDPWLEQLPPGTFDEAVPMLFRMGPDTVNVSKLLRSGHDFRVPVCRSSVGLSTDEPLSKGPLNGKLPGLPSDWRAIRIYVFSPRAWTQPAAEAVLKEWHP